MYEVLTRCQNLLHFSYILFQFNLTTIYGWYYYYPIHWQGNRGIRLHDFKVKYLNLGNLPKVHTANN